jgi:glycosyltransferase involved in cell wall biosynthesis
MRVNRLFYHLKRGKLTFIGKPLFQSIVFIELTMVRWLKGKPKKHTPLVNSQLTAVIKTFERPQILKRLVSSIKHFYPGLQIIIVDDSKTPVQIEDATVINMAYDSGVSAGRNRAVEEVESEFLLLLDDDFIFYSGTDLEPAMEAMVSHTEIDIMGGEVLNLPHFYSTNYSEAGLYPTPAKSIFPRNACIAGFPVYDKVANFYIARTQQLKRVGWDDRIKRLDHAEFFTRAKGILTTVYNSNFKILHAKTPFDKHYMSKRNDVAQDRKIIQKKFFSRTSATNNLQK